MKWRHLAAASLFAVTTSAFAQTGTQPAVAPVAALDAARTAAAVRVIDRLWPVGTYRRMMDGTLTQVMDKMMESMLGMRASDMMPPDAAAKGGSDKTMLELAEKEDPHFRERFKITMDVMMREMLPVIEKIEPSVRESMTHIYARDYTEAQLADLDRFLASPTGTEFGKRWMMSFVDPEMTGATQKMMPELIRTMPEIMKKVEAATAHLPPPPKRKDR